MNNKNKKSDVVTQKKSLPNDMSNIFKWHSWFVLIFGAALYVNTISHQFTQDDAIVIYDNMYTTKGIAGLKGLFTKDTFFGFFKEEGKAKLVSGGRYRPFTPAMFAIEYQLVGKSPWLGHVVNMFLYGFLCFMVYFVLIALICYREDTESKQYLVLAAALIYAAHPLHTEAVANIKGRDEIMSMLGSIMALYALLKYIDLKQSKYIVGACLCMFIAYLSKENAITFLAVIPLALYYFRDLSLTASLLKSSFLLLPTLLFLVIRASVLGNDFGGEPMELMNNPYLKYVDGNLIPFDLSEKFSTIIFTLGKYVQLLLLPHPLTHDYYPRYIDIMHFGDIGVLLSIALYIILIFLAIKGLKTKSIVGFSSAYFLTTLSIVSNIVFPIGTNMSERFMFMPSLGFALLAGYILKHFLFERFGKKMFLILLSTIVSLYSFKTITRNFVWESDYRLFTTDVKTSVNSAKVLNAAGGALTTEAVKEKNESKKLGMLSQAIEYLNQAIDVHPNYKNAYLILGNAYYYLKEYDKAIISYEKALSIDPDFKDAVTNLAISLRDAGRQAGEKENNLEKSRNLLLKSYQLSPNDTETMRLLGVVNGIKGDHLEAVKYFTKVIEAEPDNASGYLNLSNAYRNASDVTNAEKYMKKATTIDPEVLKKQN